ncbi:MAG TPA: helix-turn-helix domain-containing protein [Steroidobacteraceae bacterium]|nr:helix-turn-helix domain-containing protein [Steroidobacteraceae bacterium]
MSAPTSHHPRRRRQADRVALSDRRLTDAAIELLIERGTAGTTLQAIGERAGYSRGLVTHRFGSKAGLFRHVLHDVTQLWRERLEAAVAGRTGIDAICAAADALRRFITEEPDRLRAMYMLWFLSIDPSAEFRANVAEALKVQRADVARWVREGQARGAIASDVSPVRFAEQFCASTYGIVYQWLFGREVSHERMYREFIADIRARLDPAQQRAPRPSQNGRMLRP